MKIIDKLDKKFSDSLTESQNNEISSLEGIGREEHYFGGVQLANVVKDGENIGWSKGSYKGSGVCQTTTDFNNWKTVVNHFKPEIFLEFGVARGGNMVYINDLIKQYSINSSVIGFDIKDDRDDVVKKNDKLSFHLTNSISEEAYDIVSKVIKNNPNKKCMIHFDDHHASSHVFKELNIYSKLLKKGDCIIVGDTWDEGWYESPYQALKNFLNQNDDFVFEENIHKKMEMPCNWIFGILTKN